MSGIYPEFIRQTGGNRGLNEKWDIIRCSTSRGNPKTCITDRTIAVPLDADELARVVRAHELMHVRVSPPDLSPWLRRKRASFESLIVAEETRVNYLLGKNGFDPSKHLLDPSDYTGARDHAKRGDLAGLIRSTVATWMTAGASHNLRGVQDAVKEDGASPDLFEAVSNLNDTLDGIYSKHGKIASSDLRLKGSRVLTKGFTLTEHIAQMLDKMISIASETNKIPTFNQGDNAGIQDYKRSFAPLVFGKTSLSKMHNGNMGKAKLASPTGRNPRRIHRLLTDPYKRIFDRTRRVNGSIVLIDQSGSMSIGSSDVLKILDASPGATIASYAHKPGSKDVPNIWILAKDGKMVDKLPKPHGGGNGVDGPALRWAMSARRRANEPILWVCDGQVTDGQNDGTYSHLTEEARQLARKGRVVMRGQITSAIKYLKKLALGQAEAGPHLIGELARC